MEGSTEDGKGGERNTAEPVDVEVYVVTGTKNLRLPESFCEECNMFVNSAKEASKEIDIPVNIEVYSWWKRFPVALRHGGYHPPVMVVGGRRISQGHHVPSREEVAGAIEDAVGKRNNE